MSHELTEPAVLHTIAVYLREHTFVRVKVDGLGGDQVQAAEQALDIVQALGKTPREELLTRLVGSTSCIDLLIPPTSPETN